MKYSDITFKNDSRDPNEHRPALSLYHPNARGTGCAVKFVLHPAKENMDGYIEMDIASQVASGPTNVRFDWDGSDLLFLDFLSVAKVLQVFRGECESTDEGRGIVINRDDGDMFMVRMRHVLEPYSGYMLEVSHGDGVKRTLITNTESLGLCEALSNAMTYIAFGVPAVR